MVVAPIVGGIIPPSVGPIRKLRAYEDPTHRHPCELFSLVPRHIDDTMQKSSTF